MKKPDFLNDLRKKLLDALPDSAETFKKDIEKNFRVVLQNAFTRLDLVTREEFDAQTKVLARSRKKIEALEKKVDEMEKNSREKNK
ncbi:MAG TPA: accessory factor UbiK family protein [Gammaproteobacteria bacterium]|nr:accessory factor UbiK family protein [Gammaproteobacteria bacterium]